MGEAMEREESDREREGTPLVKRKNTSEASAKGEKILSFTFYPPSGQFIVSAP
jgi:hypothetical protein